MASRRDWGRTREFEDIEEGLYQCTPGADQEYGSRMSNLVMQFSRMGSSDREFLRVLLDSGGSIDHGILQTPRTSEVGHRASFTPGSELYQNPGRVLHTPSQPPSDSAFDQRTGHRHRSNRAPVLPPPTDSELEQRLGYHPTAVSQALFSPPTDSVFPQRPGPSYNQPPLPQIPATPASGFSSPVPPKLAFFSGEGHKNEASYPQWRSEVESLWKTGEFKEAMIIGNMRRSLRGRAADVLLAMGSEVSIDQILSKFDVRFGDVFPADVTLEQFFTAKQLPNESIAAWGCRLEDLLSRVRDPISASAARSMLRSRYWSGIQSKGIRGALRHHFDSGADFEFLLKHARLAEQESSVRVAQQSVTSNKQPDKLDMILAQFKDLNTRVKKLEDNCMNGSQGVPQLSCLSGPGQGDSVVGGLVSTTMSSLVPLSHLACPPDLRSVPVGPQNSALPVHVPSAPPGQRVSGPFRGKCFTCGQIGHRRGSPDCPGVSIQAANVVPGNGLRPEWVQDSTW